MASFDGGGGAARLAGGDPALQRHLAAAARLEAAAVEQAYGDVKAAETHLAAAEAALGLSMELTGEFSEYSSTYQSNCSKGVRGREGCGMPPGGGRGGAGAVDGADR